MNESKEGEETQADEDLNEEQLEQVSGGIIKTPTPGGPLPIPYPHSTE